MEDNKITMARWWASYDRETRTADTNTWLNVDELASGRVRTYWGDVSTGRVGPIADSAPSGTAFATGHRTHDNFIGVENLFDTLEARGVVVVSTREEMLAVTEGPLWGLSAPVARAYDIDKPLNHPYQPTLAEMTSTAINILS